MTNHGLDSHAYQGPPSGFRRSAFPNGEPIAHPSTWKKLDSYKQWEFDELLKTRAKNSHVHVPISTDDALALLQTMLRSVSK